jgi:hypothetical protein
MGRVLHLCWLGTHVQDGAERQGVPEDAGYAEHPLAELYELLRRLPGSRRRPELRGPGGLIQRVVGILRNPSVFRN